MIIGLIEKRYNFESLCYILFETGLIYRIQYREIFEKKQILLK